MPPTTLRRVSWAELLRHPEVVERSVLAGPIGVMAFHGGLEAATAEIAIAAAAASGASLYVVSQPEALRWHVPSHAIDPAASPALAEWLGHVELALAVHGYGRVGRPRRVLLGGRARAAAEVLRLHLAARLPGITLVTDLDDMPTELRGLHPANPVNRPAGGGVQVELPPAVRDRRLSPGASHRVALGLASFIRHSAGRPGGCG